MNMNKCKRIHRFSCDNTFAYKQKHTQHIFVRLFRRFCVLFFVFLDTHTKKWESTQCCVYMSKTMSHSEVFSFQLNMFGFVLPFSFIRLEYGIKMACHPYMGNKKKENFFWCKLRVSNWMRRGVFIWILWHIVHCY